MSGVTGASPRDHTDFFAKAMLSQCLKKARSERWGRGGGGRYAGGASSAEDTCAKALPPFAVVNLSLWKTA